MSVDARIIPATSGETPSLTGAGAVLPDGRAAEKAIVYQEPPEYDLIRRRGERNIIGVKPENAETVFISKNENFSLYTCFLRGCTSMLVATKDPQNNFMATLTHFGPTSAFEHRAALREECEKHVAANREITAVGIICLARGWVDQGTRAISLSSNATGEVQRLQDVTTEIFKERFPTTYQLLPYDTDDISVGGAGFIIRWQPEVIGNAIFEAHGEHSGLILF